MTANKNNTIVQKAHQKPSGAIMLRVTDQSMFDPEGEKSYSEGDFLTVDTSRTAIHKNLVLVADGNSWTFRRLLIALGGKRTLQALNPRWPSRITKLRDDMSKIGVTTGKWVAV